MITLQRFDKDHLGKAIAGRNKHQQYFRQIDDITQSDHLNWYSSTDDIMYAIYNHDEYVGVCGLTYVNTKDRHTELSFYFFEDYINEKMHDVLDLLIEKAFHIYNLQMVYVEIYGNDELKNRILIDHGFKLDGRMRRKYFLKGKYYDSLIYSILVEEWEDV